MCGSVLQNGCLKTVKFRAVGKKRSLTLNHSRQGNGQDTQLSPIRVLCSPRAASLTSTLSKGVWGRPVFLQLSKTLFTGDTQSDQTVFVARCPASRVASHSCKNRAVFPLLNFTVKLEGHIISFVLLFLGRYFFPVNLLNNLWNLLIFLLAIASCNNDPTV